MSTWCMWNIFLRVHGNDRYKLEHHTTSRSGYMAAKSNFCPFLEDHIPTQSTLKIGCWKKLFLKPDEVPFLPLKILSTHFLSTWCIWKMLLRVQGNDWYKLAHHTTRRNGCMATKSDLCRFLEDHTPTQSTFKIGCWKKLFLKPDEIPFFAS